MNLCNLCKDENMKFTVIKHYMVLMVLAFSTCTYAQTILSGGDIFGVIKKANSPYKITGDIRIPKDSTLTIEAGVVLDFDSAKVVRIDGTLKSMGTANDPITMTCSDSFLGWYGLMFIYTTDQDTSFLNHTKIEYIGIAGTINRSPYFKVNRHPGWRYYGYSAILAYDAGPIRVNHCKFRRNWRCTEAYRADLEVRNSEYYENIFEFGIYTNGNEGDIIQSKYSVIDCHYFRNYVGGWFIGDNASIEAPGEIRGCLFENGLFSLGLGSTKTKIINCTWDSSRCTALQLQDDCKTTIENCVFDGTYGDCIFGGDVRVLGNASSAVFKNCVFKNKKDYITTATIEGTSPMFLNCRFDNNIFGLFYDSKSSGGRVVNCQFTRNQMALAAAKDVTVLNSSFVNNWKDIKDKNNVPELDSSSGAIQSVGGKLSFYNSLFWGNKDYFNRDIHLTIRTGVEEHKFYNCIIEGGRATIKKQADLGYRFNGIFQACDTTTPILMDAKNGNYRMAVTCSGLPSGFNKGYTDPIKMSYQGMTYNDILEVLNSDFDGNPRIYGDTVDIGPYEVQVLASRIDVLDSLKDQKLCLHQDGSFWARANSIGLLYEWQTSTDGTNWKFAGNKPEPLVVTNALQQDSGTLYRIKWANGCSKTKISRSAQLLVVTPKVLEITVSDDTINLDETTTLSATPSFKSYQWINSQTTASITLDGSELGLGNHTIHLVALDSNGCEAKDSIEIVVQDLSSTARLTPHHVLVYPNPATDIIHIPLNGEYDYSIRSVTGHIIQRGKTQVGEPINIVALKTAGLYIIQINTPEASVVGRFLKN